MKKLIIILLLFSISCKKEEIPSGDKTSVFKFQYIEDYSDFRLLTKEGEIQNTQIIEDYAHKYESEIIKQRDFPQPGEFRYTNSDTVISVTGTVSKKLIHTSNTEWQYFASTDTTQVHALIYNLDDYVYIFGNWGLYKPYLEEKYEIHATGFRIYYNTVFTQIAKQANNELALPMMESLYINHTSWPSYKMISTVNNKFDENFISFMRNKDTLLLREYNLIYQKE